MDKGHFIRTNGFLYYEKNPFLKYVFGKGDKPINRFIKILFGWYILIFVVCWYDGTLFLENGNIGLIQDLVMYVLLLVLTLMTSAMFNMFKKINELFDISEDSVGLIQVFKKQEFKQNIFGREKLRIVNIISLNASTKRRYFWYTIIIWFMIYYLFQIQIPVFSPQIVKSWANWPQQHLLSYFMGCLWSYFAFGIILANISWYTIAASCLIFKFVYKLTRRNAIKVIPVSPDGKGGLACLGKMSFATTLILIPGLVFMIAWILLFGIDLSAMIGLPIYLFILILIFFSPLYSVHQAMSNAKKVEMGQLSKAFRIRYEKFMDSYAGTGDKSNQQENSQEILAELSRLEQLYRRAERKEACPHRIDPGDFKTIA